MKENCAVPISSGYKVCWVWSRREKGLDTEKAQSPRQGQRPRAQGDIDHRLLTEATQRAQAEAQSSVWPRCARSACGASVGSIHGVRRAGLPSLACPWPGHHRLARTCDHFLLHSPPSSSCVVSPCPGFICEDLVLRGSSRLLCCWVLVQVHGQGWGGSWHLWGSLGWVTTLSVPVLHGGLGLDSYHDGK